MRPYLLILISALCYTAAFPPFGIRALAWVALVPLIIAIGEASPRSAIRYGFTWAYLTAVGVTHWLPTTLGTYYGQPLWLGIALFAAATLVMVALEYSLFAGACVLIQRSSMSLPRTPFIAAAWVSAEFLREKLLTGNPWAFIGYTQTGAPPAVDSGLIERLSGPLLEVVQIADIGGVYAVSFTIVAANAALAQTYLHIRNGAPRPRWLAELSSALLVIAVVIFYGHSRLVAPEPAKAAPEARLLIAQGNLDIGAQWAPQFYGRNLGVYLDLTRRGVDDGREIDLVVWPENAMTFFVATEPAFRKTIADTTAGQGAELLSGAPRAENRTETRYFNSAVLLSERAEVVDAYDKEHLLPFAEYFPFSQFEMMRRSFGRVRTFSAGTQTDPLSTGIGQAGILICNEAMYGGLARDRVQAGAEFLVNLSNDTWVSDPMFAQQQLQIAAMRAVETNRYLVRASTSGPSAIISPRGRVLDHTPTRARATLEGAIRVRSALSVYVRIGDVFALGCLVLTMLLTFENFRRHRQSPSSVPQSAERRSELSL